MELLEHIAYAVTLAISVCFFCDFMQIDDNIFAWYEELISRLPTWLYKPLGGCVYCVSVWAVVIFLLLIDSLNVCNFVLYTGINYFIIDVTHARNTF